MAISMVRSVFTMGLVSVLGCASAPVESSSDSLESRFGRAAESMLGHPVRIETGPSAMGLRAVGHRTERLVFEGRAEDGVRLHLSGEVVLRVLEDDASGRVTSVRGALTHPRVGGASYWTPGDEQGIEEWLALDEAFGDRPAATWRVEGHTLREVVERAGVHVLRDGRPVAFVTAPQAVNDLGERVATWLRVEGDRLALYVDGDGATVLADPLWVATGELAQARVEAPLILVPGGAVILGGYTPSEPFATIASVERYDALTGVWSSGGSLVAARGIHAAVALASGEILVAGGDGPTGSAVATADRYDPATATSSPAGSMSQPRISHTLTRLPSGRVLAAGGNGSLVSSSAEIYDPATNAWTPTGSMAVARSTHTATLLPSGRVLVIGGTNTAATAVTAELYDPATGTFTPTGSLSIRRHGHSATLLASGLVLVAGGRDATYLASAELYDPSTGTFTPTGSMSQARNFHSATLLASGRVLIAGGSNGPRIASAEIYDPVSGTFSDVPPLSSDRIAHGAVLLASGRVLVAGGDAAAGGLTITELFDESPICGNGELETGEDCDDGNTAAGDCCDPLCAFEVSSTVCRAAVSPCDIAERCSGTSGSCPIDVIADSVTTCRAASCSDGQASPVTHCTGLSTVCPPPTLVSCAPFACADSVCGECDTDADCGGLRCEDHLCVDPGDAGTDAGEPADAGSDAGSLDAGSDGGASDSDAGPSDAGARDAGASDAGVGADAGDVPVSGGCGCAVPRAPASRSHSGALLLVSLVSVAARRSRSGRRRAAPRPS